MGFVDWHRNPMLIKRLSVDLNHISKVFGECIFAYSFSLIEWWNHTCQPEFSGLWNIFTLLHLKLIWMIRAAPIFFVCSLFYVKCDFFSVRLYDFDAVAAIIVISFQFS